MFRAGRDRRDRHFAARARRHRHLFELGVHRLRPVGNPAQPDRDLRDCGRRRARMRSDGQSSVTGDRTMDDDQRELQQQPVCERLRVDRRYVRRPDGSDVHGRQVEGDVDHLFGERKQRLGNRSRGANHDHLALGAARRRVRFGAAAPRSLLHSC